MLGGAVVAVALGCHDNSPPPQRVPVPAQATVDTIPDHDPVKPLPPQDAERDFHPPFDDVPLVSQRPPEQPAFVDAYHRVGSPRITLFVNRTFEGNLIPLNPDDPIARAEITRRHGGASDTTSASLYLHPGQYDEVSARSLDYEAVENIMTDWLAANGQVTIISPAMA